MLVYQILGSEPGWHHLANVFIHTVTAILVFLFFRKATGDRWPSALVAVLFGLHPMHVESVAWISERKDVLGAFFWFLTLLLYARYIEKPNIIRYSLVVISFFLGLMSKPILVSLPIILFLLDCWPFRRVRAGLRPSMRPVIGEKVPLLVLSAALSIVTFLTQRSIHAVASRDAYPLYLRFSNAVVSYWIYLEKTFWPSGLALPYPYSSVPWLEAIAAALGLLAITYMAVAFFRTYPFWTVGWLWFVVTLVPVIGVVQVGSQARADRYMYIPMVGIAIMVAWGGKYITDRWPRLQRAAWVTAGIACAAMVFATWIQIQYWSGPEVLFQHSLAATRDNAVAHLLLAEYYKDQNRGEDSLTHGREAVRLLPGSSEAHIDLAAALAMVGNHSESAQEYRNATSLQATNAIAHSGLGLELARTGDTTDAVNEYQEAIRLEPSYAISHYNLGRLLAQLNRTDEAVAEFSTAVRLDPDNADYHCSLGIALGTDRRINEAIAEFEMAIRLQASNASAHFNLGSALAMQGRLDEAIAHFRDALAIDPSIPGVRESLDKALELVSKNARQLGARPESAK